MAKSRVTQNLLVNLAHSAERFMPGLTAKRIRITCSTDGARARVTVDLRQTTGRA